MSIAPKHRPDTPGALRALAQWYRDFAKLGSDGDRQWRLDLAAHFDRLAEQHERAAEGDPERKPPISV